ncbi:MAG: hypothetical protein RLZZ142_2583 [Verrucomicrobiota bacterium]
MTPSSLPLAIGIDFGGTSIKSALVRGPQLLRQAPPINPQNASARQTLDAISEAISELCSDLPSHVPIGIGLPGLVDSTHGVVHGLSNVEGWEDVPVRQFLADRFDVPVILENDANAMAYGEWRYGAAQHARSAICITLGTGVGGALILDGHLYRGARLAAGELGHVSIDHHGKPGPYGNRGGLEEYVGNAEITARAQAAYDAACTPPPAVPCTPEILAMAAHRECPIALALWEEIASEIGAALASAVWLLNPEIIVIGGGVAKAGDPLFGPLRDTVRQRTSKVLHEELRIVPALLGNHAGAIGCAALALDAALAADPLTHALTMAPS